MKKAEIEREVETKKTRAILVSPRENEEMGLLVDASEVFRAWVATDTWMYVVRFAAEPDWSKLDSLVSTSAPEMAGFGTDPDPVREWLEEAGFDVAEVRYLEEVVPNSGVIDYDDIPEDDGKTIIYDYAFDNWCCPSDLDWNGEYGYSYWDGSNWRVATWEECDSQVIEYDDSRIDLNEWDGSNWRGILGGRYTRNYAYPMQSIDDKPVDGLYLIEEISQWQGVLPSGKIINSEELDEILEEA